MLRAYLLPKGYPDTVSGDYVVYQCFDTMQGLMSYLKGVLCTMSFLRGLGVGSGGGALHQAMVVWIVRDGTSCLSGLAAGSPALTARFASRSHVKQYRLGAETLRGVAGLVELAASTRGPFLPLICAATVCNSFAGVVDSCTRSSLMTHFARSGNFSDCSAKEGNQDRAVKLVGIAVAAQFLATVGGSAKAAWAAYGLLTLLHLLFNALAMRALQLDDGAKRD